MINDPKMGKLSIIVFSQPFDSFFCNIKFIKKLFNTKINKIIRISLMLKNSFGVNYLIMKIFIRRTNFKHRNINVLTKPCLCDMGIKLSKLVNALLKVGFLKADVINLLFSLQILTTKNEKLLFFSTSIVNLMIISNLVISKFK